MSLSDEQINMLLKTHQGKTSTKEVDPLVKWNEVLELAKMSGYTGGPSQWKNIARHLATELLDRLEDVNEAVCTFRLEPRENVIVDKDHLRFQKKWNNIV
jgi:hypothetical protein